MSPKPITRNTLFYGDNLSVLRDYFPDECVIEDLLKGKQVQMPPDFGTFKQAQRVNKDGGTQGELGI